jgi:hypothetical protein
VIVLWAALVVALTAAAYSVTWDLCNAGNDEPVAMATPLLAENDPPPRPTAAVRRGAKSPGQQSGGHADK